MTKAQLLKKIAILESINDQLATEVLYVDELMKMIGFSGGLATVKATAHELLQKGVTEGALENAEEVEEDDLKN